MHIYIYICSLLDVLFLSLHPHSAPHYFYFSCVEAAASQVDDNMMSAADVWHCCSLEVLSL